MQTKNKGRYYDFDLNCFVTITEDQKYYVQENRAETLNSPERPP